MLRLQAQCNYKIFDLSIQNIKHYVRLPVF